MINYTAFFICIYVFERRTFWIYAVERKVLFSIDGVMKWWDVMLRAVGVLK